MKSVFIEAESFEKLGGWVVDTASMEQLHSAYIMAHGMGIPVEDAVTTFEIQESGTYYIWALTRDCRLGCQRSRRKIQTYSGRHFSG